MPVKPFLKISLTLSVIISLSACSHPRDPISSWSLTSVDPHKHLPKSHYGNPKVYRANGATYHVLDTAVGYKKRGTASWYGKKFNGRLTSTREVFNMYALTAASPELPIPCFVRVTNLRNHRSIILKVNDRGPFVKNRLIDLSYGAAIKLGYASRGTAPVLVESLETTPRHQTRDEHPIPAIYWQTGVFGSHEHAKQQAKHLNSWFFPLYAHTFITQKDGHSLYHVTIGPLHTLAESDKLYFSLKQHGLTNAIPLTRDDS